jgi:hypothetical protein
VFTEEPSIILQLNNFLEVSYLLVLLITSNNFLECIIIIWTSIFSCYVSCSSDMLASITHVACSLSSIWRWYPVITLLSSSLSRTWGIGFSKAYNFLSYLITILIFRPVQEVWLNQFISIKYVMYEYIYFYSWYINLYIYKDNEYS